MTIVGVAALDANVLVPIVACDFLLTAFDQGLFEPVVSATVLDEVERTLFEDFSHLDRDGLRRRAGYMRTVLNDHIVDAAPVDMPPAINAKDRHVVAAAIAGEAVYVVTDDRALRDEIAASVEGVEPLDGDGFAMKLWDTSSGDVNEVIIPADRQAPAPTGLARRDGSPARRLLPVSERSMAGVVAEANQRRRSRRRSRWAAWTPAARNGQGSRDNPGADVAVSVCDQQVDVERGSKSLT